MRRSFIVAVIAGLLVLLGAATPAAGAVAGGAHYPGWVLAIQASGNGSGRVISTLLGTPCSWDGTTQGGTCAISGLAPLQRVDLDAIATSASTTITWTNCTRVTGTTCTVDDTAQFRLVKIAFTKGVTISVTKAGTGSGTVTSAPTGINCGTVCSAGFAAGQSVTLTAAAAAGSIFVGWGGACAAASGAVCTIVADAAKSATATFSVAPSQQVLTVTTRGAGRVTSSPAAITCPGTCSASFTTGTGVSLSASAGPGYRFDHWEGCDTTSGVSCTVNLTTSRSVTAVFVDVKVDASVAGVSGGRSGGHRTVTATLQSSERVTATVEVLRNGHVLAAKTVAFGPGHRTVTLRIAGSVAGGSATVEITLRDAAGNERTVRRSVTIPR